MDRDVYAAFRLLNEKLNYLIQHTVKEEFMLEELATQVERTRTVSEGARTLIKGLAAEIEKLAALPTVDPEQLAQLSNALRASTDELADAVAANTPAEEEDETP
jgi:hypothetical protein